MQSGLENWITIQRNAIIANWREWGIPPAVAIEGTHVLGLGQGGPEGRATKWLPMVGYDSSIAMVQVSGLVKSLWVDPRRNNYVEIFRKFLSEYCGVDPVDLTKRHDVDHMYNRERAVNFGYSFVRMFPIPVGANRSHGAGYEKAMTESDVGRRRKVMKLMDEVSTMKFLGILSPSTRRKFSIQQREHVKAMADLFDLSVDQIEDGINNLMGRAHGE